MQKANSRCPPDAAPDRAASRFGIVADKRSECIKTFLLSRFSIDPTARCPAHRLQRRYQAYDSIFREAPDENVASLRAHCAARLPLRAHPPSPSAPVRRRLLSLASRRAAAPRRRLRPRRFRRLRSTRRSFARDRSRREAEQIADARTRGVGAEAPDDAIAAPARAGRRGVHAADLRAQPSDDPYAQPARPTSPTACNRTSLQSRSRIRRARSPCSPGKSCEDKGATSFARSRPQHRGRDAGHGRRRRVNFYACKQLSWDCCANLRYLLSNRSYGC